MAFVSRGLFDEVHSGEIDPGIQRVYFYDKATGTELLGGYLWVNSDPDGNYIALCKYVLLFEPYVMPGNPNVGRNPDAKLRFVWDSKRLNLQQAVQEYTGKYGAKAWKLVKQLGTVEQSSP